MSLVLENKIKSSVKALQQGLLIAYPTEAVYGLGCDPQQPDAVERLINLKKRNPEKGLILNASTFEQLAPYLENIDDSLANRAKQTWPGPKTWVWPVNKQQTLSPLLTGRFNSIAVRVTNHPIVTDLCDAFQGAIVSTSANLEGEEPAKSSQQVREYFPNQLASIIDGPLGGLESATPIFDVITQQEIRA